MGDEIKLKIATDISNLQQQMSAAAESVEGFGTHARAALEAYNSACKQGAEAQKILGEAFDQAMTSGQDFTHSMESAVEVLNAYNAAAEASAAASAEAAAGLDAVGISARQSMAAGIGMAEGRLGGANRAASAFLATTLGLGPVMQAAFPVIGALAFGEVVDQIGSKLGDLAFEAEETGQALGGDIWTGIGAMLEGIGWNIDDLIKQEEALDKQTAALFEHSQQLFASYLHMTEGPQAAASYLANTDDSKDRAVQARLRQEIATLHQLEATAGQTQEVDTAQGISHQPTRAAQDAQLQLELQKRVVAELQQEDQRYQLAALDARTKGAQEQTRVDAEAARKRVEMQRAADRALMQAIEQGLAEQEALHGRSANQTAAYLGQFLDAFSAGSSEALSIVERYQRAQQELGRKESASDLFGKQREQMAKMVEEARKGSEEYLRILDGMEQTARKLQDETIAKPQRDANALAAEQSHEQTMGGLQVKTAQVQTADSTGVSPKVELDALRSLHEQELAENERYIRQEMQIYAQEPEKLQQLQKQLDEVHNRGLVQEVNDTAKALQQQEALFKRAYGTISQDFNETINKFITSTEKPAQAFAQMFDKILAQLADFAEQWLEKKAEMWLIDAVTGRASQTAAAASTIASDAAVAAAGAYAATAPIPFVGPVLAPAAAATAYAATMSFMGLAAFEQGGIVGGSHDMPVPIMAHAGERVLSAPQTQNFERLVNQPRGGGNTLHLNYAPNVNAMDRSHMSSIVRSQKDTIVDMVREAWNSGSFKR